MKRGRKVSVDHPIIQKRINKSLNESIREGAIASTAASAGENYFPAFAILLNATSSQIGILHAIINLLPSIVQVNTFKLFEFFSRKKIVLTALFYRVLLILPIILCGYLFYIGYDYTIWILILFIGLYYSLLSISHMAWFSWMGSLVPEDQRGTYFSKRNKIVGLWGILGMIFGAIFLDSAEKIGIFYGRGLEFLLIGFGILFLISMIFRIWANQKLSTQYEPRVTFKRKDEPSFWEWTKKATKTPFGKFSLFAGFMSLAIGIASPFWAVYMLRDLGFSYFWFIAVTISTLLFQLMFLPLMGKATDKFGNVKIFTVCTGFLFLAPLLWLPTAFMSNPWTIKIYLLIIPQAIAGFAWAGYNLTSQNYVYDAIQKKRIGFALGYKNLFVGAGIFLGALLGSYLASLNTSFNPLFLVFLVSAIARMGTWIIGVRHLEEVRHVKKFSSHYLIREFEPVKGAVREIHHLEHLVHKIEHKI